MNRHVVWAPLLLGALVVGCGDDPAVDADASVDEGPPIVLLPLLELTTENAVSVAASVWADNYEFDVDQFLGSAAPLLNETLPLAAYAAPGVEVEIGCSVSGTTFAVATISDPTTPGRTPGDSLVVSYVDCDQDLGGFFTLVDTGTVSLIVDDVNGEEVRSTLDIDVTSTIEGVGAFTSKGVEQIAVTNSGATTTVAITAGQFEVDFNDGVFIVQDLSIGLVDGGEEEDAPFELEFSSTTSNPELGGSYTVETPAVFKGLSNTGPEEGVMLVTGANGAQVRLTALGMGSNLVSVEIDDDADGVFEPEDTLTTSWEEFERTE